jgi:periplasmic protein TonB
MQQPEHTLRRQSAAQSAPRRLVGIVIVAGLHLLVIWAVAISLANGLLQKLPTDLVAKVETTPPPPEKLPPPPPPELVKPPPPFVPPPDITIANEPAPTNTITVQNQVATPPPKVAGITAPASVGRPHNCPQGRWYPPNAVRLNQEGVTVLSFKITTDGDVKDATVAESSGHDSLDQAAIECVTQTWHYKPAMENGQPVEATWKAQITWKLAGN